MLRLLYSVSLLLSQANLKKFLEYIQSGSLDRITKALDKGLDPNYHHQESGGVFRCLARAEYAILEYNKKGCLSPPHCRWPPALLEAESLSNTKEEMGC